MHQKISYEIFSKRGIIHEKQGRENEDAINVVTNGDYMFVILSDGAGSSDFAKEAALTTVETASNFCYDNSSEFFKSIEIAAKKLVFDIQTDLDKKAMEMDTELSKMVSTLVVLGLEKSTNRYVTIHIGDGLIALKNITWEIISYPENGPTKQYTYFVNSPLVFKHLRINEGDYNIDDEFFISTDGYFEHCNFIKQYINCLIDNCREKRNDDTTYCRINI